MSVAITSSWSPSPDSSFIYRNKQYQSATSALDDYIKEFEQDTSWTSPSPSVKVHERSGGCSVGDVYDQMLKAVKSGSPDGKESPGQLSEMTIANVSRLPSTPCQEKDDDAETTVTDLLTDGGRSQCISRCSPVGNSSSEGSSGNKSNSPERSTTPSTTTSQRSGSRPKARRSLDSPLKRSPSPFVKLHPDVPANVVADRASPLNKLHLPSSPLKQAEDFTNVEIPRRTSVPSWVNELTADGSSVRRLAAKDTSSSKIPTWLNDLNVSSVASSETEKSYSFLDVVSNSGSESLKDLPKWLRDMDTSDVTTVLNLIEKQLKDKSISESAISGSFLSDCGDITSSQRLGIDKRYGIPGRKIFWDDGSPRHKNRLLSLKEKDKIRQRLVKIDDHNHYRMKRQIESVRPNQTTPSPQEKPTSINITRSRSVDRLSFHTARSVSDITSDTDYLVSVKPSISNNRTSSSPSLSWFSHSDTSRLGSSSSLGPRRERMSEFRISKLLSPPRKPLERARSLSAYNEFKKTASEAGRTSSPIKYNKSMFLDDTSLYTSRKSPRSERAEKMIRDALAVPLLKPGPFDSSTSLNTDSLLNAKVTSFSTFPTTEQGDLLSASQHKSDSCLSGNPPGSMETLKNILFSMQNVAASTAEDGEQGQDKLAADTASSLTQTMKTEATGKTDFYSEFGGEVLQKAFTHLSNLKSLVSDDLPHTDAKSSS